jgi:hypothetical protein
LTLKRLNLAGQNSRGRTRMSFVVQSPLGLS